MHWIKILDYHISLSKQMIIDQKNAVEHWNYDYFTLCKFFIPALADGLSLESEWQQVSSGLQDSSEHFSPSQQCCSLNILDSSSDFSLFQSPFQSFRDCSKHTNYNCYHCYQHVPLLFFLGGSSLTRSKYLSIFSLSLIFYLCSTETAKSPRQHSLLF